ncbi:MAG: 3-phosphoshikimate 1-carboxyvinyltransferase [Dysgonamonadaceae bacterium]|jgi:3-phosphoshikimate 1-carboxyvinyltransferase|nr:3-phosphoshikimate 1-carboxyvinyltransferase [Dysgonamonadaceae bacterium]
MIYRIQAPKTILTSVKLPASKSISNRVLILNALGNSLFAIENLSDSDDTQVLLNVLQSSENDFNIGAAGTSMRFLTAYLSQRAGNWTITGSERMKKRPIAILVDALRQTGAEIEYLENEGFPPLKIHGKPLIGGEIRLNGGVSSQYISALLMIAPCMQNGLTLQLEGNIISKPYIRMTLGLMKKFGVQADWNENRIRIEPQAYHPVSFRVESDWSAASYWFEIQALATFETNIELQGLEKNSLQGDAQVEAIFAALRENKNAVFAYDFINEPDLAQTLTVTCCLLEQPFRFTGLQSLRIKETDRLSALQTELKKLGYLINIVSNSALEWNGEHCEPEPNPVIATYEDHRMAMAFALVCLRREEIQIAHPEVVTKSYPDFWKDLKHAGFLVIEKEQ